MSDEIKTALISIAVTFVSNNLLNYKSRKVDYELKKEQLKKLKRNDKQ
ncbi:unnamed protein product [Fructobacillus fructosus]|uniref:Phage protein n=1 Tax=Fructobacillus fructosus TaxID=1631 RepID=A0ABN9YRI0_9LACO|nr:unnamed protein product [Fructobacillus fructosus]